MTEAEMDVNIATHIMSGELRHYSADASAAFLVVEKLRARFNVKINTNRRGWYCGFFARSQVAHFGQEKTLPLAICAAAVRSVGLRP